MANVRVNEEQVLFFRACRGHLAGDGAATLPEAARAILGAQSQQLQPSLLALSLRTASRPTASEVRSAVFGESKSLVRTWGQRGTIHLYDAESHWRKVIAANPLFSSGGRCGALPSESVLRKARTLVQKAGKATRSDLVHKTPASYVKAIQELAAQGQVDPKRFAAGRLLWRLAHQGDVSIAEKIGVEQSYAARESWFAHLDWPEVSVEAATTELTRDYLRVYGPATPHDVAHFFGAKVSEARRWLDGLRAELTDVSCGDRENLVTLTEDAKTLRRKPSPSQAEWPVRLLPLWESVLMAHADKSWTVAKESERKLIWRKAAMVSSVVLARGRVVANWTQKATTKRIKIQVQPLAGWRKTRHLNPVKREAKAIARHLELDDYEVEVA